MKLYLGIIWGGSNEILFCRPVELNLGECPPVVQDLAHFLRATFQAVPQGKKGIYQDYCCVSISIIEC